MTEIDEEENVIYGINNVLMHNTFYITENTIREEWGYKPRVNHEANELLCENVLYTYKNLNLFTISDFF